MTVSLIFVLAATIGLAAPAESRAGTYFDVPVDYPVTLLQNYPINEMASGDFDSDELPDLILTGTGYANRGPIILETNKLDQADGGFAESAIRNSVFPMPFAATAIDFNSDGFLDIATTNSNGIFLVKLYQNYNGVFRDNASFQLQGREPGILLSGDFNTDDAMDLVAIGSSSYTLTFLLQNGSGLMPRPPYSIAPHRPSSLVAADFNRDGRVDLAYSDPGTQSITVLINDTAVGALTVSFTPIFMGFGDDVNPSRLLAGDFDGRNGPDLAFADADSNRIYVMFSDGNGFLADPIEPLACSGPVGKLAAGDVDLDGKSELIAALADANRIEIFSYTENEGIFNMAEALDTGRADPVALIAVDLNADEKIDLAAAYADGGNTVSVWLNNYEPVVDLSELVTIGAVSSGRPYSLTPLGADVPVYIDRPYAVTELSPGLEGGLLLQTANNDKWIRTDAHLQLWVHGEAILLACYDSRARRLPTWLETGGWTRTMEWIRSSDYRAGTMQVFMKEVSGTKDAPTELWLGGNHDGGYTWARSNYYLMVQPRGAALAMPPVEITAVSTGKAYKVAGLHKGGRVYIDRHYHAVDYSEAFDGAVIVQTANNDKWVRDSQHLTLKIKKAGATVFACYDRRARRLPAWLRDGSWTATSLSFTSTDHRAGPMTVLMRRTTTEDEELYLGGNQEGGYTWARSNYLIVVQTEPVDIDVPEAPLVQVSGQRNFQLGSAEPGRRVYLDRGYRIEDISSGLQGGVLVMTANNDKGYRGGKYMQLQVRDTADVYVCFDRRKSFLPHWLADSNWNLMPAEAVLTGDHKAGPMLVYMRTLEAGETLDLGGNLQGGYNRARSNYFVVVQPAQ
jgi:hypothetical protein